MSQYAFVISFPAGFVAYLLLIRALVLPFDRQAEIGSRDGSQFLATSEGMSWIHSGSGRFSRIRAGEVAELGREDL